MTTAGWIPDATAIHDFRESPELFRLRHRLGLVPASPDDKMRAGSALHAALDVLRRGGTVEAGVTAARAVRGEGGGGRDAEHCERIVRAYATRYPAEAESWRVVASEAYVEAMIESHDPPRVGCSKPRSVACTYPQCACDRAEMSRTSGAFRYCGIQDAVVEFPDGSSYVLDVKSTGAYLAEAWAEAMRLSDQMTGYVALRRALGYRCDGYLIDGIHVTDYVPKGGGGPRVDILKDFVRIGPVPVPAWRVERWARDVRYTLAAIAALDAERGPDEPWPSYQNWAYGKVGAYAEFLTQPAELHGSVAALFERRPWRPREVAAERASAVLAPNT